MKGLDEKIRKRKRKDTTMMMPMMSMLMEFNDSDVPSAPSEASAFDPVPIPLSISHKSRVQSMLASKFRVPPSQQNNSFMSFDLKSGSMHLLARVSKDDLKFDFYCGVGNDPDDDEKEKETDSYYLRHGKRLYDNPRSGQARSDPSILFKKSGTFVESTSFQVRRLLRKETDRAIRELIPGGAAQKEFVEEYGRIPMDGEIKCLPQNNLEDLILCTQHALTHKYARDLETSGLPMPVITSVFVEGLDRELYPRYLSYETPISDVLPPNKRFALSIVLPDERPALGATSFEYNEIKNFYPALVGDGKKNEVDVGLMKEYKSRLAGAPLRRSGARARVPTRFDYCPKSGIEVCSPPIDAVKFMEGKKKTMHLVKNEGQKAYINGIPVVKSLSCHKCKRRRTYCHICYINENHRVNFFFLNGNNAYLYPFTFSFLNSSVQDAWSIIMGFHTCQRIKSARCAQIRAIALPVLEIEIRLILMPSYKYPNNRIEWNESFLTIVFIIYYYFLKPFFKN